MTIICYRDGIMAADSFSFVGEVRWCGTFPKIARGQFNGVRGVAGASGAAAIGGAFLEWFGSVAAKVPFDAKIKNEGDFSGIAALVDGTVWRWDSHLMPYREFSPFYVDGSGGDVALGAMAFGASAEEAVRVCCEFHAFCGGDVTVLRLHED